MTPDRDLCAGCGQQFAAGTRCASCMAATLPSFPHCDQRVLHAPGECDYCDERPEWQALRAAWGIAFTGHSPAVGLPQCGVIFVPAYADEPDICRRPNHHTGSHSPVEEWERLPCPADFARPPGAINDHRNWRGNQSTHGSDHFRDPVTLRDMLARLWPRPNFRRRK